MGEGEENTNPGKGEAHRTWKLGPGSSIPSRDQRTLSCHCSFGVLDEVVPFIFLSQACYLCPILSVPKTRPELGAGRFVPEGKRVGLPCLQISTWRKQLCFCIPLCPQGSHIPTPHRTLNVNQEGPHTEENVGIRNHLEPPGNVGSAWEQCRQGCPESSTSTAQSWAVQCGLGSVPCVPRAPCSP